MRVIYAAFLAISIFLVGCSPKVDTRTIDGLIEHFKSSGLVVTAKTEQIADIIGAIGATEGIGVGIYGQSIAIYRFDTTNTTQRQNLEKIAKAGTITVLGSIALPAQTNGSFIITGYQDHPEKQKILDAFKSWSKDRGQKSGTGANQISSNKDTELMAALNGVWKPNDSSGLFKFSLSTQQKIVSVVDGDKTTNIAVKVASVDSRNNILNLQYESDPKRTMTLKQDFTSGSSTKFNLLLTLSDGQTGSLAFVRNIDSSDDLKIVNNSNPSNLLAFVGKHPAVLVGSAEMKERFEILLGTSFKDFLDRLEVASDAQRQGNWLIGIGSAPHLGGSDEAAFGVNVNSGEITATMLVDGKNVRVFGVNNPENLPPPLLAWFRERAGQ